MRIALVHDDLIQHGGAERVFLAMLEAFPRSDVYTSLVSNQWKSQISNLKSQTNSNNQNSKFKTSFMQCLPFKEKLYRHYFPLYPLAFESFDLTGYDVVLSSSTRFAHGVITRPETLHICYMNTPPRMFWEPQAYFSSSPLHLLISPFLSYLRLWDYAAAQRVDYFIANSKTPQARIRKYYGRDSHIIYPFVDLERFQEDGSEQLRKLSESECQNVRKPDESDLPEIRNTGVSDPLTHRLSGFSEFSDRPSRSEFSDYFLVVSRLAAWKRIDIAIEACNRLKFSLKIIGEGPDRPRLEKLAGPTIELLGRLTDEDVVGYYRDCCALIFPQKEDFGITPLEAQAAGKPVIAYGTGGALETIIRGKTGEFFQPQTVAALVGALKDFDTAQYRSEECWAQAEKFGKKRFQQELKTFVEETYEQHTRLL